MGVTRRFNADGSKFEEPPATKEGSVIYLAGQRLTKTVKRTGTGGIPDVGDMVSVHYVGYLADGTVFDSSRKRKKPFQFTLGHGNVIDGWDAGVATMHEGECSVLTCAPEYAYGAQGSPPVIPPNATLSFEVELLSFEEPSLGSALMSTVWKLAAFLLLVVALLKYSGHW